MKSRIMLMLLMSLLAFTSVPSIAAELTILPDDIRSQQIKDMKFGMFICWSFSTFSGYEWTRGVEDVAYFRATGCDTDQWCQTAKDAGMNYILFLTKHHDGFCLWDTQTTEFKVTNAPLGIDVLAKLRKSCDKYGIKLALYFSEGDWTWIEGETPTDGIIPGGKRYGHPIWRKGESAELKKAQLKELCTKYGPIEFFWMDHAQGTGGLTHAATTTWVRQFQPNCFVGYNHGEPSGRLALRERGTAGPIGDSNASAYNKEAEASYTGYLAAEFTYPILPKHKGGADWFYSLPRHNDLCQPAAKLFDDYKGAVKYGNIFSINVGPNYEGRIRDIDVKTLGEVGTRIRDWDAQEAR
jgi:alpha-L-fucosidase